MALPKLGNDGIGLKLVIATRERRLKAVYVKKKQLSEDGKTVILSNAEYYLDPSKSVITYRQFGFFKKYYNTFYYPANSAKPMDMVNFSDREIIGISAQELRQLFNPRFYNIIARAGRNTKREDLMYYLQLFIAGGVAFTCYELYKIYGFH